MEENAVRNKNIQVIYEGPFRDAGGYAKMNREIVKQLSHEGIQIKTIIMPSGRKCAELNIPEIEALQNTNISQGKAIHIFGKLASNQYSIGNKKNVVFTMMETQTIAKTYVEKCNMADELFVPSDWNIQTFRDSGVNKPMYKVPLGVDTDLYNPNVKPMIITEAQNKFIFFSLFGWSLRKGCDILVRAFVRKYANNPYISLVIASRIWGYEDNYNISQIRNDIKRFCIQEGYNNVKNIVHLPYAFPEEQLPSLFKAAHCYVSASRGEGWNLPAIEAGACEIPIIAIKHGAQLEFLDDSTTNFIDIEGYETCKNLKLQTVSSFYTDDCMIVKLGEKSIQNLADKMEDIVCNYKEARIKAKKLRQKLINQFTWNHSAKIMINRLNELYDE